MNYWTNAPDWVNFIAVDADGHVWGFEQKPVINYTWKAWMPVTGLSECLSLIEDQSNWENSLEERPKNQNV